MAGLITADLSIQLKISFFVLFRQAKPKSNTKVFGLGFSFAKIQYVSAFLGFWQAKVALLRCSYGCVRIPFAVS